MENLVADLPLPNRGARTAGAAASRAGGRRHLSPAVVGGAGSDGGRPAVRRGPSARSPQLALPTVRGLDRRARSRRSRAPLGGEGPLALPAGPGAAPSR